MSQLFRKTEIPHFEDLEWYFDYSDLSLDWLWEQADPDTSYEDLEELMRVNMGVNTNKELNYHTRSNINNFDQTTTAKARLQNDNFKTDGTYWYRSDNVNDPGLAAENLAAVGHASGPYRTLGFKDRSGKGHDLRIAVTSGDQRPILPVKGKWYFELWDDAAFESATNSNGTLTGGVDGLDNLKTWEYPLTSPNNNQQFGYTLNANRNSDGIIGAAEQEAALEYEEPQYRKTNVRWCSHTHELPRDGDRSGDTSNAFFDSRIPRGPNTKASKYPDKDAYGLVGGRPACRIYAIIDVCPDEPNDSDFKPFVNWRVYVNDEVVVSSAAGTNEQPLKPGAVVDVPNYGKFEIGPALFFSMPSQNAFYGVRDDNDNSVSSYKFTVPQPQVIKRTWHPIKPTVDNTTYPQPKFTLHNFKTPKIYTDENNLRRMIPTDPDNTTILYDSKMIKRDNTAWRNAYYASGGDRKHMNNHWGYNNTAKGTVNIILQGTGTPGGNSDTSTGRKGALSGDEAPENISFPANNTVTQPYYGSGNSCTGYEYIFNKEDFVPEIGAHYDVYMFDMNQQLVKWFKTSKIVEDVVFKNSCVLSEQYVHYLINDQGDSDHRRIGAYSNDAFNAIGYRVKDRETAKQQNLSLSNSSSWQGRMTFVIVKRQSVSTATYPPVEYIPDDIVPFFGIGAGFGHASVDQRSFFAEKNTNSSSSDPTGTEADLGDRSSGEVSGFAWISTGTLPELYGLGVTYQSSSRGPISSNFHTEEMSTTATSANFMTLFRYEDFKLDVSVNNLWSVVTGSNAGRYSDYLRFCFKTNNFDRFVLRDHGDIDGLEELVNYGPMIVSRAPIFDNWQDSYMLDSWTDGSISKTHMPSNFDSEEFNWIDYRDLKIYDGNPPTSDNNNARQDGNKYDNPDMNTGAFHKNWVENDSRPGRFAHVGFTYSVANQQIKLYVNGNVVRTANIPNNYSGGPLDNLGSAETYGKKAKGYWSGNDGANGYFAAATADHCVINVGDYNKDYQQSQYYRPPQIIDRGTNFNDADHGCFRIASQMVYRDRCLTDDEVKDLYNATNKYHNNVSVEPPKPDVEEQPIDITKTDKHLPTKLDLKLKDFTVDSKAKDIIDAIETCGQKVFAVVDPDHVSTSLSVVPSGAIATAYYNSVDTDSADWPSDFDGTGFLGPYLKWGPVGGSSYADAPEWHGNSNWGDPCLDGPTAEQMIEFQREVFTFDKFTDMNMMWPQTAEKYSATKDVLDPPYTTTSVQSLTTHDRNFRDYGYGFTTFDLMADFQWFDDKYFDNISFGLPFIGIAAFDDTKGYLGSTYMFFYRTQENSEPVNTYYNTFGRQLTGRPLTISQPDWNDYGGSSASVIGSNGAVKFKQVFTNPLAAGRQQSDWGTGATGWSDVEDAPGERDLFPIEGYTHDVSGYYTHPDGTPSSIERPYIVKTTPSGLNTKQRWQLSTNVYGDMDQSLPNRWYGSVGEDWYYTKGGRLTYNGAVWGWKAGEAIHGNMENGPSGIWGVATYDGQDAQNGVASWGTQKTFTPAENVKFYVFFGDQEHT